MSIAQQMARALWGSDEPIPEDPVTPPAHEQEERAMNLELKKRRYNGIYKRLLTDSGYGELAKMVNVHREGERGEEEHGD